MTAPLSQSTTPLHPIASNRAKYFEEFLERIDQLEERKADINESIREVKNEAKAMGFNIKALNEILRLRKMELVERYNFESDVNQYKHAAGMELFESTSFATASLKKEPPAQNPPDTTIDASEPPTSCC